MVKYLVESILVEVFKCLKLEGKEKSLIVSIHTIINDDLKLRSVSKKIVSKQIKWKLAGQSSLNSAQDINTGTEIGTIQV